MKFKVVTPVSAEPVTLAEGRLHLKLTVDDSTAEDSLISVWLTAAREVAEQYTGRALAPRTLEAAMDCFPAGAFDLPMPPVTSITSIKYTDAAGVEQTLNPSTYSLSSYGESRRVAPAYNFVWPFAQDIQDAVRIRFVTGYTTVPTAVKSAMLLMLGWMFEHRGDEMSPYDIQPPAARALLDTVAIVEA